MFVFVLLFLAIGLGILGLGLRALWASKQVETWPTTWGTLLERDLVESSDSDGSTYRATVRYRYQVAGRTYESDRIAYGYAGSSGYPMHRAIHERLQSGETVRVHYDPRAPVQAALAGGVKEPLINSEVPRAMEGALANPSRKRWIRRERTQAWPESVTSERLQDGVVQTFLNTSTLFLLIFGAIWTVFTCGLFLLIRMSSMADHGLLERLIVR